MASFLDRLRDLFRGSQSSPASAPGMLPTATDKGPDLRAPLDANFLVYRAVWDAYYDAVLSRRARYNDYDRMDNGWIAAQLDDITNACLISDDGRVHGVKIIVDNPQYQAVVDQVLHDTNVVQEMREILRSVLKYGDSFVAPVFTEDGNIVALDLPPVRQMIVNVDDYNRLLSGEKDGIPAAYQQVDDAGNAVAGWYPWEMFHLKYAPSRQYIYSRTCYLEPLRPDWHKLRLIEEAMVVNRLLRAPPRQVHYVDVTGKTTEQAEAWLKVYRDNLRAGKLAANAAGSRQVERTAIGVDEDIFVPVQYVPDGKGELRPTLGKVELLDPQLQSARNMADIEYIRDKLFSYVSKETVGIRGEREDLSQQDVATGRLMQWCQVGILENQLLRPLLGLALFLKFGGVAKNLREALKFRWPQVQVKSSWRAADATFRLSMANANKIEQGLASRKRIAQESDGLSDQEWEEEVKQIMKEKNQFPIPDPGSTANLVRQGHKGEAFGKNGNSNG